MKARTIKDAHIFPGKDKKKHVIGEPHMCICEPVTKFIEKTPEGYIWRRVIVHGVFR